MWLSQVEAEAAASVFIQVWLFTCHLIANRWVRSFEEARCFLDEPVQYSNNVEHCQVRDSPALSESLSLPPWSWLHSQWPPVMRHQRVGTCQSP